MFTFRRLKNAILYPPIIGLGERIMRNRFEKEPIFIGGCGRSGTTLLLAILSAHPDIFAIQNETAAFNIRGKGKYPRNYHRLCRRFLFNRIPKNVNRFLEKTPANVLSFREIDQFFEGKVKLVHIVRDGRDVTTSIHPKDPGRFWVPIERWIKTVNAGLDCRDMPNVYTLKYEELTEDPESTLKGLCSFLDLNHPEKLIEWTEKTQIHRSPAWFGEVQATHTHSRERWKRPEFTEHIEEFMANEAAVETLIRAGYYKEVPNEV